MCAAPAARPNPQWPALRARARTRRAGAARASAVARWRGQSSSFRSDAFKTLCCGLKHGAPILDRRGPPQHRRFHTAAAGLVGLALAGIDKISVSPIHEFRVHVINLAIARGDRTLIESLSFTLSPGDLLHLQGRNGAGKTSLLETLCGLRAAAGGQIEHRPELGQRHWLGHKNALNPALSPLENLRFWCHLHGAPTADCEAALQRVGLRAQRHRPCGGLSTGQRRRAALARLLAAPRPYWFLDEPLAGLDSAGLDLFGELLYAHRERGGATLLTSHQPLPIDRSGVRILVLDRPQPRRSPR